MVFDIVKSYIVIIYCIVLLSITFFKKNNYFNYKCNNNIVNIIGDTKCFNYSYINDIINIYTTNNKFLINIKNHIDKLDIVKKAIIYIDIDNTLYINIYLKTFLLKIINLYKDCYFVDTDGYKINFYRDIDVLLNIEGYIEERLLYDNSHIETNTVMQLYKLGVFCSKETFWIKNIKSINVNLKQEIEIMTYWSDTIFLIEDSSNLEDKFNKLLIFYYKIIPKIGNKQYKIVNIQYTNQIICSK